MVTDKQNIINHYSHPLDKETVSKVYDKADKVFCQQVLEITDFLDPNQLNIAEQVVNSFPDITALFYGGFPDAERKKVGIFPKEWNVSIDQLGLIVLNVQGNFKFTSISHRDVMGTVLGLGLKREKLGDILVQEDEDRIIIVIDQSISQYIIQNMTHIKNTPVSVDIIDHDHLPSQTEHTREISGTVSSLRLDAVASVGFGASRSKMTQLIKAERVKLNWQPVADPKSSVKAGDVVSLRGKGRIEISDIGGKSRKGRSHIVLKRYK